MSNEYIDLAIMTNGKVCRAPGFSGAQPGQKVIVQGFTYDVLEAVSVPVSLSLIHI